MVRPPTPPRTDRDRFIQQLLQSPQTDEEERQAALLIEQGCREIQSRWSETERRRRAGQPYLPYEIPEVPGENSVRS